MKIVLAADHGGVELKEILKRTLIKSGHRVEDVGTHSSEPCDYPEYGFKAALLVSRGKAQRGIVICKTGIGMSIVANKLPGVRAGLCSTVADAVSAREHNDTNILVLASARITEKKAREITKIWLATEALGGRHKRRVKKITELEKKVFKKVL